VSRSYRQTPICGWTTARSDRLFKTYWHRALRRINRQRVQQHCEPMAIREYVHASVYRSDKDGKQWLPPRLTWDLWSPEERLARYQKLLRK
jgi:hypothetical protein